MSLRYCTALLAVVSGAAQPPPSTPPEPEPSTILASRSGTRFVPQFEFDEHEQALQIVDFQFVSARRGIAVGLRGYANRRPEPVALLTSDGGVTWTFDKLKTDPYSVFFLDETLGWLVGEGGIYKTEEAGRSWRKISSPRQVRRVFFVSPSTGWALGAQKTLLATTDGGKTWGAVEPAAKLPGKPEHSAFLSAAAPDSKKILIAGASRPPRNERRPRGRRPPDPEEELLAPEWPSLSLFLQSSDGGATWNAEAVSLFGVPQVLRYNARGEGVWLMRFLRRFPVPSDIIRMDLGKKPVTIFGRKDRVVTDVAMNADGSTWLAAYQPAGSLPNAPVPGKVRVLRNSSSANKIWEEFPVHYRAVARQVFISAPDPENVWIATDQGMILKWTKPPAR
ncbi:MAG TPA: hypothetical protein DEH78_06510 [Solibacterales bacterium]|nr:hypothetical protein [Bryobacterales bacterium]